MELYIINHYKKSPDLIDLESVCPILEKYDYNKNKTKQNKTYLLAFKNDLEGHVYYLHLTIHHNGFSIQT